MARYFSSGLVEGYRQVRTAPPGSPVVFGGKPRGDEKRAVFYENVTIITGASSGIGRETALQLAGQGAWLTLAARNAQRLELVAHECRHLGARALVVPTDVGDEEQCRRLIHRTAETYGRIDTLLNNAGYGLVGPVDRLPDIEQMEALMQVNFLGSVYCTYHALSHLKQSRGRIVAVSSLAGRIGLPWNAGYSASKHAMAGFFDSLRSELADSGVSVTVIYPGFLASEFHSRMVGVTGQPLDVDIAQRLKGRVMSAEHCARLIVKAVARRRREVVMTSYGKVGLWLKLIMPGLLDRLVRRKLNRAHRNGHPLT